MVAAVGLAFVLAAVLARGPWPCRTLAGAIGVTWLGASLVPTTVLMRLDHDDASLDSSVQEAGRSDPPVMRTTTLPRLRPVST